MASSRSDVLPEEIRLSAYFISKGSGGVIVDALRTVAVERSGPVSPERG